jgi:hypothetical protein
MLTLDERLIRVKVEFQYDEFSQNTKPARLVGRTGSGKGESVLRSAPVGVHEIRREQHVGPAGEQHRALDLAPAEAEFPPFRHGVAE